MVELYSIRYGLGCIDADVPTLLGIDVPDDKNEYVVPFIDERDFKIPRAEDDRERQKGLFRIDEVSEDEYYLDDIECDLDWQSIINETGSESE